MGFGVGVGVGLGLGLGLATGEAAREHLRQLAAARWRLRGEGHLELLRVEERHDQARDAERPDDSWLGLGIGLGSGLGLG